MKNGKVEWSVTLPTVIVIAGIFFVFILIPEKTKFFIEYVYKIAVDKYGWAYIAACMASFAVLLWISFSKYGNIKLGGANEKPQYSNFSWGAMIFTSGVGSSAVILGFMEPLYYLEKPPFEIAAFSEEAYEYAHMYGQFHWGLSAWAFYIPAIAALGIAVYKENTQSLRFSSVIGLMSHKRTGKILGKFIDILVMVAVLAGVSTSLGLAVPVISKLISDMLQIPNNLFLQIIVIGIWILIFTVSVVRGLDKGIKILSNINIYILFAFAGILLLICSASNIFKAEVNSIGLYLQNFIRINTWLDPYGHGDFQRLWTIFYWGWWLTFMPMMAMFVVRVSKGRTLKNVIWLQMIFGTLGCWLCFCVFGGYSLNIQKSGQLDLVHMLNESGQDAAMVSLIKNMQFPTLMTILFCVLIFVFLATTIDSTAFVLAGNSQRELGIDSQPGRIQRVFWALMLAVLSVGLLFIGEIKALQTVALLAGVPLIFLQFYLCWAGVKLVKKWGRKN